MICLVLAFGLWYANETDVSVPGLLSAFVSAALFAMVCLRFVPEWMRFWDKEPVVNSFNDVETAKSHAQPQHAELKIFAVLLLVNTVVVLLVYCLRLMLGYRESFLESLKFWTCTDSQHYLDIARDWYLSEGKWDRLVQLVFLPGYPLVVRLLNYIINNFLYSGMIASALSFAGAGCVLYRLLRLDLSHKDSLRALKYLCILPGAFFFAAPMSESLFLLLCVSCIYFARTKRWALGCLFGGLASFTRSLGLTLFVPLFFELIASIRGRSYIEGETGKSMQWVLRFISLLLIPAGFAAYCYINYLVSGNPFKFMEYQQEQWGQRLGLFFNTAAYQLERAISSYGTENQNLLGLWIPNLISSFGSLAIISFAEKKMHPSYTAWFITYFVIAIGATWLLSAPRYLMALFPISIAISALTKRSGVDIIATLSCILLYFLYLLAFVMRWQVW